ncbi:MAG: Gfo/Idh/MocA family oxidoreductase [Bacteroidota bacterium]
MPTRRKFIQQSGKALLATSVLSPLAAQPENAADNPRKIGYAVVGLGWFAGYVIPRIIKCEKSTIVALISSDQAKAQAWRTKYRLGNVKIYGYDEFDKVSKNKDIDAIYIATPVGTHAAFAFKAFEAGKHVLTEKTMAGTVTQAQQMIEAAKKANRKLMVGYRSLYEPYNQKVFEFAQEKKYGQVTTIAAHKGFVIGDKLGKNQWRTKKDLACGGALVDIGIYSVQACRLVANADPVEVSAFSFSTPNDERFKEVEENVSFMMRFADGLLATGSASWHYSLQNYYRVGATEGYVQLEPASSNTGLRMLIKETNPTFKGERFFADVDQIPAMFDHFSTCILEDKPPMTDGAEGLRDLKIIEALYQSIAQNKPVKL